ncbi:MAG: MBL fold metallo-hydrolase [Methanobacteriaceae archaeon]|jgi:glyoxylase-like metal-dependent hydrolase (beta-lactamase superfamily II)|nr:MBL fold metallo-hydrolase [Methanobacteriaceae archaeon]
MNLTTIKSGNTNCYLIKSDKGHVLVDSRISSNENDFIKKLEKSGVNKSDDNYLILTHGHYDHIVTLK